jgi:toxin ParE1/3/4
MDSLLIRLSNTAKIDLENILKYLWEESLSKEVLENFINTFEGKMKFLSDFPLAATGAENVLKNGRKVIIYQKYIVFYTINIQNKEIQVVRILHGSMDINTDFFDL